MPEQLRLQAPMGHQAPLPGPKGQQALLQGAIALAEAPRLQ